MRILLVFFIFFIPLYPKFPAKCIEYTYICIRFDDFFIVFLCLIFFIQLIRKKIKLNTLFLKPILLFWIAIFFSLIWGIYVAKNLHYHQVAFLHTMRRIEYMLVLFIAASSIKSVRDFKILLSSLLASLFFVDIYGLGQRFLGFPAVQTMNPAFSRGMLLFLTEEARLSSTFAGHYDLAAYLVFLIPVVWGSYFAHAKTGMQKVFTFSLALLSTFILSLTASRTSVIAYIISTPLIFIWLKKYRYAILVIIFSLILASFSRDLTKRFANTFQIKQFLVNEKTGEVYVSQHITSKDLPAGSAFVQLDNKVKESAQTKLIREGILREATLSGKFSKSSAASHSANFVTVSGVAPDISFATRLQVEWPRAIAAFAKNPILGTGPSSITESTDNDYLRWLGEFGLFGFLTFIYILFSISRFIYYKTKDINQEMQPIIKSVLVGVFGLLINALYIDVFEASKVAYVFWFTFGIYIGFLSLKSRQDIESESI